MFELIMGILSFMFLFALYGAGVGATALLFKTGFFDTLERDKPDDDMIFYCSLCWVVFLPIFGTTVLVSKLYNKYFEKK